jgi:FkbM family methyltransferase
MLKQLVRRLFGIRAETDFFSQGGEDAIIWNTFLYVMPRENGTFLDIGSYHPFKYSNTYLLYKAGWRGCNVDPRPGSKELFDRYRGEDINIEAGVARTDGRMLYYMLDAFPTLNTFSKENLERLAMLNYVSRTVEIPVFSLRSVIENNPRLHRLNYLNVDAEGFELEILEGLSELDSKPEVISIEQNTILSLADVLKSDVCAFLEREGYVPFAKNVVIKDVSTVFYIRK